MIQHLRHSLKTLTIICFFVTLLTSAHATMYYSARSGNPTVLSNWTTCRCGVGPSPTSFSGNDTFIIQGTHNMVNISNWAISGAQSGLFIENTGSLRAADSINLNTTTTFNIQNGGAYFHNNKGFAPTSIFNGIEVFAPKSNVEIIDWFDYNTPITVAVFGNLKISYNPAATWNQKNNIQRIDGNFMLDNRSTKAFQFADDNDYTLTINKNIIIKTGLFNFSGPYNRIYQLNIRGGLIQTGGNVSNPIGGGSTTIWKLNFTGDSSYIYRTGGGFVTTQFNYAVQSGATFYVTRRTVVSPGRSMDVYGSIVCDTFKITGNGTFHLHDYASMYIAADSGINLSGTKGNITTRTRVFSTLATYIYNGRNNQFTGTALPSIVYGFRLNLISSSKKLVIRNNLQVTDSLNLSSGIIQTNTYLVTLGTGTTQIGNLQQSNAYVYGNFARYLAPAINSGITGLFPVGTATAFRPIQIEFTTAPVTGGLVKSTYMSIDPGDAGLVISDAGVDLLDASNTGYWKMEILNGDFRNGVYTGTVYPNYYADITDPTIIHILSRTTGGSWTVDGTHVPSTGTITNPIASRNGMTKITEIGISASNFTSLPVEWNEFNVSKSNNDAEINWSTNMEINNNHFEIEKSTDAIHFETIATIKSNGNSSSLNSYTYLDQDALLTNENNIYYRIKQVDNDLKFTYTDIAFLEVTHIIPTISNEVIVYPNPSSDYIKITSSNEIEYIQLIDMLGITKYSNPLNAHDALIDLMDLPKGNYMVHLVMSNQTHISKLIIKN